MLGLFAATTTTSALHRTIASRAIAPTRTSVPEPANARARPPRRQRPRRVLVSPRGPSRRGSVRASLDMRRARRSEPPEISPRSRRSARLAVDGLRALVPLLGVVGHLRSLLQRAVALAIDPRVMDEQVLVPVIGGDESEPLVVAEPLYGASWHVGTPPR